LWEFVLRLACLVLLVAVCLEGCVSVLPKHAFDADGRAEIRTIAITTIENPRGLTIRRYNPVYAIIGTSGILMQQAAMAQKSAHYKDRVGDLIPQSNHFLLDALQSGLTEQGYKVHTLDIGFWQSMKLLHAHQLPAVDALLRVKIERLGFRAGSISAPYQPSLVVSVQLIRADISRKILYEDTLSIGYKATYHMTMLNDNGQDYSYPHLSDLMEHALQSKSGLFIALRHAADRINHDLEKNHGTLLVQADSTPSD